MDKKGLATYKKKWPEIRQRLRDDLRYMRKYHRSSMEWYRAKSDFLSTLLPIMIDNPGAYAMPVTYKQARAMVKMYLCAGGDENDIRARSIRAQLKAARYDSQKNAWQKRVGRGSMPVVYSPDQILFSAIEAFAG